MAQSYMHLFAHTIYRANADEIYSGILTKQICEQMQKDQLLISMCSWSTCGPAVRSQMFPNFEAVDIDFSSADHASLR